MAAALLAAASGGGVTDLRTTVAMTSVEAAGRLCRGERPRARLQVGGRSLTLIKNHHARQRSQFLGGFNARLLAS